MKVIALEDGFDNEAVRHAGDEFDMPDDCFADRPRLDEKGKPTGEFYDPPHWFEPADPAVKAKLRKPEGRKTLSINPKAQADGHEKSVTDLAGKQ